MKAEQARPQQTGEKVEPIWYVGVSLKVTRPVQQRLTEGLFHPKGLEIAERRKARGWIASQKLNSRERMGEKQLH